MSTTSLPAHARKSAPRLAVKPPILASDILREEVAPRTPGRTMIRIWLGAFAGACALSAGAARMGVGPHDARVFEGSLGVAVLAALGAAIPLPYAARAAVAVVAGGALLGLGVTDRGPLAPIGHDGALSAMAFVALATLLPAALFFRARFRAFRAARVFLGVAIVLSVPAVALGVLSALSDAQAWPVRVADAVVAASALSGFFGFMGAETSAGGERFAALVLGASALRVAVRAPLLVALLTGALIAAPTSSDGTWGYAIAGVGELASSLLVAYGLFQLLAQALGGIARTVDVHQVAAKPDRDDRFSRTSEED